MLMRRICTKSAAPDYIEKWEKLPDGRFFLQLKGVNRFRFSEELELQRGYRRVKALYQDFPDAVLQESWQCDRSGRNGSAGNLWQGQRHASQAGTSREIFRPRIDKSYSPYRCRFIRPKSRRCWKPQKLQDREKILVDLLRLGAGSIDDDSETPPRTLN